jgi:hypothetical protein
MVRHRVLARSENTAEVFQRIVEISKRFGIPSRIQSDTGSAFAGHLVAGGNVSPICHAASMTGRTSGMPTMVTAPALRRIPERFRSLSTMRARSSREIARHIREPGPRGEAARGRACEQIIRDLNADRVAPTAT